MSEDPQFEQFMEQFGDFFPENPQSLEELLEQMAQRMAAMQAMLNSMTPEQRAQLQQLSDQLLEDMDLRWQMDQLGQNLRGMFPQMQWNQSYDFEGQDPMGMAQAMQTMQELGDLDQLENLLRNATNPGALAEADMDRVRELMGDDAAKSLGAPGRAHEDAAGRRPDRAEGGPARTHAEGPPQDRLQRVEGPLHETHEGQERPAPARSPRAGSRAHVRDEAVRVRRPVQPRPAPHDPQRDPAQRCRDARAPVTRRLRDRAHRAHHQVLDGADARPVAQHADARQLPAGEEGGDGAALADHVAVPARLHGHRRLQRDARILTRRSCPR
ncbi:MAG: hypothetical protein R2713_18170 [Ilumatobacteraceae bacterium]